MNMEGWLLVLILLALALNVWLTMRTTSQQGTPDADNKLQKLDHDVSRIDPLIRDEFARNREEYMRELREARAEQALSLKEFGKSLSDTMGDFQREQRQKHEDLVSRQDAVRKQTDDKLGEIRSTVEIKLASLQEDNNKKLEEMRKTVDEKLQEGLETRFNQSFKRISESLENVYRGLGEMQTLATGVGDLKRVLSNVKSRGIVGEIQLQKLLSDFLAKDQYEENVLIDPMKAERVEFAIRLPGSNDKGHVYLPIDSKFPMEAYLQLLEAYDKVAEIGQPGVDAARKVFQDNVVKCAKTISEKYIKPPHSTDFAILFVPTEGLYAEVLQIRGLFEDLQSRFRITVAGPSTIAAILNSLQMGFRTLAIEQRSSEVWQVLGAVKTEFGKFSQVLEKTKKRLEAATRDIDGAGVRTRAIERQLRSVESLTPEEASNLLDQPEMKYLDEAIDDENE